MYINIVFNDDLNDVDIVYLPSLMGATLEELQGEFYKWIFNNDNNHKFWINIRTKDMGCIFRSEAFVEWFNDILLQGMHGMKAKVVKQYQTKELCGVPTLYF